jgi:hypothetical protein
MKFVTRSEVKEYEAFARTQTRDLASLVFDEDTVIWHYTNGSGLLGILQTGLLFASQVACVNDATEVVYAQRLYRHALQSLRTSQSSISEERRAFVDSIIKATEEESGKPFHAASKFFIACFSLLQDSVDQWLKYGGLNNENGFSIGFRANGLIGHPNRLLAKVNYDRAVHESVAAAIAQASITYFEQGKARRAPEEQEAWRKNFDEIWDLATYRLAPLVKDECFSSEKEFRLIHELQGYEYSQVCFRAKPSMLTRYLPLAVVGQSIAPRLPITEIWVGPGTHQEISRISVGTLLVQMGYTNVPVKCSTKPLQRA